MVRDVLQDKYDLLVIPGGAQGAATMARSAGVQGLVRRYLEEGRYVGMVCAGASRPCDFGFCFRFGFRRLYLTIPDRIHPHTHPNTHTHTHTVHCTQAASQR